MSVNAIECLEALSELQTCRAALHSKMLREGARQLANFRYPGEWYPEKLSEARKMAKDIIRILEGYKNTNDQKAFIIRKLTPLVEMVYKR